MPLREGRIWRNITKRLILAPTNLLREMETMDEGHHLDIGILTVERGNVFAENSTYAFCQNFLKYVEECWFEAFVIEL